MQNESSVFESLNQVLTYYRDKNPARQKFINLIEAEKGSTPAHDQFSGGHPHDIFNSIVRALKDVEIHLGRKKVEAFKYYAVHRFPACEVAERYTITERTLYRWNGKVKDYLTEELIYRKLLPNE